MKSIAKAVAFAAAIAAAAGAGYWWGQSRSPVTGADVSKPAKSERKILYYRNPMGLPDTSPVPKKDPMGMDYVPVYADEQPSATAEKAKGKILYYRNPMGLPDTSPVPKKDAMGMDYVPVYEGEQPSAGGSVVKISTDKAQKLGVRTETAAIRDLTRTVQAVATLQPSERQLHTVAPRFEGWIEKLYVNTTGQFVRRGDPLLEVYSPDLVTVQQEYLIALKGVQAVKGASRELDASMQTLVDSALQRLRNWDISDAEVQRLQQEGKVRRSITLRAQASGVVMEKKAVAGMRFMPGEMLYQIADLSSIWVMADVFEQDLGLIRPGQAARIKVDAYPDRVFNGQVTFLYPTVTPETRTGKVRIELGNPGGQLRPSMYARVEIASKTGRGKVLAVPDSAVLDTGTRQLVLVQRGEGAFEPRPVKLGTRADGYIEVLEGIKAGENVVVSANFLIDAESNLKAALAGFGAADKSAAPAGATHKGRGTVRGVDAAGASVKIDHAPMATLGWPAMTMDFQAKDASMLKGIAVGQAVEFEIVQQEPGRFAITRIVPAGAQTARPDPSHAKGH